jgi:hypothetical protein
MFSLRSAAPAAAGDQWACEECVETTGTMSQCITFCTGVDTKNETKKIECEPNRPHKRP